MRRPTDQQNVDEILSWVLNDEHTYGLALRKKYRSAVRRAVALALEQGWRTYKNDRDAAEDWLRANGV